MNLQEIRELWCRFLDGETLDGSDQRRLLEALASDDLLRDQLLEDAVMDGMLRGLSLGD